MKRRTIIFLLICAIILLSVISWVKFVRWQPTDARITGGSAPLITTSSSRQDQDKQLSNKPHENVETKKFIEPTRHEMLDRFNRSQNYRAFIYEALKHPELGGYEYAQQVLTRCLKFPLLLASPSTSDTPKKKAIAALTMRCDMTKEENTEISDKLFSGNINTMIGKMKEYELAHPNGSYSEQNKEDFSRTEDPLRNLLNTLYTPDASRLEKGEEIRNILASEEPFLLKLIFQSVQTTVGDETTRSMFFSGQWYKEFDKKLFLSNDLAMCNFGMDCSATSLAALTLCAIRGYCGENVEDAIRNGVSANNEIQFDEIKKLAQLMTVEIKNGNVDAFLAPALPAAITKRP